jgi:SAM-dependent methyltransferase
VTITAPSTELPHQLVRSKCPLCGLDQPDGQQDSISRCAGCSLVMRVDALVADGSTQIGKQDAWSRPRAARYFDRLEAYGHLTAESRRGKKLLAIGGEVAGAVEEARTRGYQVTALEAAKFSGVAGVFDVCVLADAIERTADPLALAVHAWDLLAPGGTLFVTFHSRRSASEYVLSFDRHTAESLLGRAGFDRVSIGSTDSGMVALARRAAEGPIDRRCPVLSVVMPVFNERATFSEVATQLLSKRLPGFRLQLIIIESNSTDGTREEVRRLEGDPRVTVIYEDRPRGKGHAVRAGLARATGDFVLIQDADLEYDLDDYELLLEPLRTYRHALVLGSRHGANGRSWKLRQFAEQPALSRIMNVAHVCFTSFFNTVYGTQLRDPFTMYKVFRRDCLSGLTLESNRFDFDWELLAKLVRAGYRPVEIPIRYRSRSYKEGKKIRFWHDPLTWVRACLKYRFVRLGK